VIAETCCVKCFKNWLVPLVNDSVSCFGGITKDEILTAVVCTPLHMTSPSPSLQAADMYGDPNASRYSVL